MLRRAAPPARPSAASAPLRGYPCSTRPWSRIRSPTRRLAGVPDHHCGGVSERSSSQRQQRQQLTNPVSGHCAEAHGRARSASTDSVERARPQLYPVAGEAGDVSHDPVDMLGPGRQGSEDEERGSCMACWVMTMLYTDQQNHGLDSQQLAAVPLRLAGGTSSQSRMSREGPACRRQRRTPAATRARPSRADRPPTRSTLTAWAETTRNPRMGAAVRGPDSHAAERASLERRAVHGCPAREDVTVVLPDHAGSARARKSRMSPAISSPLSSSAQCPVSSAWNSASGRSVR